MSSILIIASMLIPNLVVANFEDDNLDVEWKLGFTVPGTKWCGPGDSAKDSEDLGEHQAEDRCCRAHDLCDHIPAGSDKYGLRNSFGPFTKLHCDCEVNFKRCLNQVNSELADRIGNTYFTVQKRCYQKEHPIVRCKVEELQKVLLMMTLNRCVKYRVDYKQARIYQWFDVPVYSSDYGLDRIGTKSEKKIHKRTKQKKKK